MTYSLLNGNIFRSKKNFPHGKSSLGFYSKFIGDIFATCKENNLSKRCFKIAMHIYEASSNSMKKLLANEDRLYLKCGTNFKNIEDIFKNQDEIFAMYF